MRGLSGEGDLRDKNEDKLIKYPLIYISPDHILDHLLQDQISSLHLITKNLVSGKCTHLKHSKSTKLIPISQISQIHSQLLKDYHPLIKFAFQMATAISHSLDNNIDNYFLYFVFGFWTNIIREISRPELENMLYRRKILNNIMQVKETISELLNSNSITPILQLNLDNVDFLLHFAKSTLVSTNNSLGTKKIHKLGLLVLEYVVKSFGCTDFHTPNCLILGYYCSKKFRDSFIFDGLVMRVLHKGMVYLENFIDEKGKRIIIFEEVNIGYIYIYRV